MASHVLGTVLVGSQPKSASVYVAFLQRCRLISERGFIYRRVPRPNIYPTIYWYEAF